MQPFHSSYYSSCFHSSYYQCANGAHYAICDYAEFGHEEAVL